MITALGITLIVILVATEIGCFVMLRKILHQRSDERTDNRRATYRAKAYKDLAERTALKNARQKLWERISHES